MANNTKDYPNSGALFGRTKRSDKSPDMGGDITLDPQFVYELMQKAQNGQPCTVELAGWRKVSGRGTAFLSLRASHPRTQGGQQAQQAQQAPQRGPAQQQRTQPAAGGWPGAGDDDIPF